MYLYAEVKGMRQQASAHSRFPWFRLLQRDFLLLGLATVQFVLFIPLAWWARKHPQPPVELAVTHLVQTKHSPVFQFVIRVLSTLAGSAVLLNVLVVPTAFIFWKRQLRVEAIMTIGIAWTNVLVRTVIKQLVYRPRPSPWLVRISGQKQTKSFPSGHVTSALTFWGWLFALGIRQMRGSRPWQKVLLTVPGLCILLVGPTRIYLGDHWTTDVLGGYLFGGGWLCLALEVYLRVRDKRVLQVNPR